jgi:hypothetical protein
MVPSARSPLPFFPQHTCREFDGRMRVAFHFPDSCRICNSRTFD